MRSLCLFFFFNDTATTEIYTLSLHDALPIFAGYITEKSLSVDNLFVFVLIMATFGVPRELQQKVLLFGISFALALRTVFIVVGAAAIEQFSWVFYLFGAILVYTAWVQARKIGRASCRERV